ncbi:D-2-hydroxyacid dehydrogenase family protein [Cupriavidus sp. 2TAF22]|uniref:D-2-hydroxyacid dehydrogenase family protein n=1 Tax=unclassified Cupriavidus TaxID=2640874 RepID=UPI003F90D29E
MTTTSAKKKIAILDDYQSAALTVADWSAVKERTEIVVFDDHVDDEDIIVERLRDFDVVCVMRERTPFRRALMERLPKLRLIASTGARNAAIDANAAQELGIEVVHTGYTSTPTIEFTWAMILASMRNIAGENASLRDGGWQVGIGSDLAGKTLGLVGLGNIGSEVARIGRAFGMRLLAWSENLTSEKAAAHGAQCVSKEALFSSSDIVSIHLILSQRTRGMIGAQELALMKPTARLVNTSRGPIVVEKDLVDALSRRAIAGAAIDVYDHEPLPHDHPF